MRGVSGSAARRWSIAGLCLVVVGLGVSAAVVVPEGGNPDEWNHLGAFRWFETHWVAPEPGSPEVFYDGYGISRVWYGEAVYPVYGMLGRGWRGLMGQVPPMLLYRLLNVALLPVLVALVVRVRELEGMPTAMFLAGLPQLIAVFASAGSDGVAIVAATAVLADGLASSERDGAAAWWRRGGLWLLVMLVKPSAWPALVAAAGLLVVRGAWRGWPRGLAPLALAGVLGALLGPAQLPDRLEPGFRQRRETVRTAHALPELDPTRPGVPTLRMRQQGAPFSEVLLDPLWWGHTAASTWAAFGPMNVRPPAWAYAVAAALWIGLGLCSVEGVRELARAGDLRRLAELALLAAGLALWLAASLLHSWTEDWQPQGRYLLPGVLALGVLLAGVPLADARTRRLRWALLAAHLALGVAVAAGLPFAVPAP